MTLQPQIPRTLLNDSRKLNEWLHSLTPPSISNAGRGHQMTSPRPRLAGTGSSTTTPREDHSLTSSATAAAIAKTVQQQRHLQEQFSPRTLSNLHAPQTDARIEAQKEDDQAALMWSTAATATVPNASNLATLKRSQALISHQRDPASVLHVGEDTGKVGSSMFPRLTHNLEHVQQAPLVDDAHFANQISVARRIGRGVLGAGYDDALCDDTLADPEAADLLLTRPTVKEVPTSQQQQLDRTAAVNSPTSTHRQRTQQVRPNASFLTPERFRDESKGPVPPVGHYRPKHLLTEYAVVGGYIGPALHAAHHPTPSMNPADLSAAEQHLADAGTPLKGAAPSPTASSAALKSPRLLAQEKAKNAVPPPLQQSAVFKSGTQKLSPPRASAAPDEWYWPRCDAKLSPRTAGAGTDMSKGSPRRTMFEVEASSQSIYVKSKPFGEDKLHKTPQLSTAPERFPASGKPHHSEGSVMTFDADSARYLVRKDTSHAPNLADALPHVNPFAARDTAVSVDESPVIHGKDSALVASRVKGPLLFDRQTNRPNYEQKLLDQTYEVREDLTLPRQRGAVMDPRATGHQPLHSPSHTEFGEAPSLNGVRPSPRAVIMDKGAKREPITAPLHDLIYDVNNPASPRVLGNPMIGSLTTRDQREKATSVKRALVNDVMYDVPVPPTSKSGSALLFSKQVTAETCFSHRNAPSHRYERSRERAPGPGTYDPADGFYHLSTSPKLA